DCPRCGLFGLTDTAEAMLPSLLTDRRKAAILSHFIRAKQGQGPDTLLLNALLCRKIIENGTLPTPQEQAENLIRWLGANLPGPGEEVRIAFAQHGASIGTLSPEGFHFVVQGLMNSGLLQGTRLSGPNPYQGWEVTLTFAGWERFEELRRGTPSGRKAF